MNERSMITPASETISGAQQTPRKWLRFSLLNLLLITTIVAMGLGLWQQNRTIRGLRRVVGDAGFLMVDDRSQIQASAVPTPVQNAWRWRLWLPAGTNYQICAQCNSIPKQGAIKSNTTTDVMHLGEVGAGESLISIELTMGHSTQTPELHCEAVELSASFPGVSSSFTKSMALQTNGGSWPARRSTSRKSEGPGSLDSRCFKLLRERVDTSGGGSIVPSPYDAETMDGLMIWVEPVTP